ncbi:MAG TPA: ankyrin repeat domain-containing protein [Bacteroidales bacterium]|nr:ankyrin repeat domain-containing protein [Bacteroidales bacterium]
MKPFLTIFILTVLFLYPAGELFGQTVPYSYSDDLNIRFLEAASNGDYPVVVECLKKGVDVNTKTWDNVTALMYATAAGHSSLVKLLLEKGADVNAQPSNGYTALITASQYGHTAIADMLLADSAKINITDGNNASALHYASLYNNDTIVFMLLRAGANPNGLTSDNTSPLSLAAVNNSYEAAYLLVDAGANVNSIDKHGFTPLMLASQNGAIDVAELLLTSNAVVNTQNNKGYSALSLAILNKHPEVVKLLLENGANENEHNSISINPLVLAKQAGDSSIVATIKKTKAKMNLFPAFTSVGAGLELTLGAPDLITGVFITQHDLKFNLRYNFGFAFRPVTKRINLPIPDFGSYQFVERRYLFHLDLGKDFNFNQAHTFGINAGGRLLYSFGRYRGTEIPINGGIQVAPQAWIFLKNDGFEIRAGYHYSNYGEKDLGKSHFTFGVIYNFYNLKKENINRTLKWIE